MLYFLIYCLSFILLSKSFSHKPIPPWKGEVRLYSASFWCKLSTFLVTSFCKSRLVVSFFPFSMAMSSKKKSFSPNENVKEIDQNCLLDLPELALDSILERLSPAELCSMAAVCSSLRNKCLSDHLWEKHMKQKWSRVIGDAAHKEWHLHIPSRKRPSLLGGHCQKRGLFGFLSGLWPFSLIKPKSKSRNQKSSSNSPLDSNSIKALYLSLENGLLWFPAQVYNRENGHTGFMLSCYDAHVCYDSQTDTFQARYSPPGRRTTEENVQWERLRAPPTDTPPYILHLSDCLNDLKPGDHIEIQWRKNKEFPYGWWYGVVGHLEDCDGNVNHCHCHFSDRVILEFSQYRIGSRWRRTVIKRKDHQEEGNEADGFYGGIRKLNEDDEITRWKHFWPTRNFDL